VLLSINECAWKLTDFGLTFEGTSRIKYTTKYSQGSVGYRAVELLNTDKPFFTKASDIWALGCIFYELLYQVKAFRDDIAAWESRLEPRRFKDLEHLQVDGRTAACIRELIHRTLEVDWWKRPTATDVLQLLDSLSQSKSNSVFYVRESESESESSPSSIPSESNSIPDRPLGGTFTGGWLLGPQVLTPFPTSTLLPLSG
jgi:serine/threonine protein kinase